MLRRYISPVLYYSGIYNVYPGILRRYISSTNEDVGFIIHIFGGFTSVKLHQLLKNSIFSNLNYFFVCSINFQEREKERERVIKVDERIFDSTIIIIIRPQTNTRGYWNIRILETKTKGKDINILIL